MRPSTISTQVSAPTSVAALTLTARILLRRSARDVSNNNRGSGYFSRWRKRSRSWSLKPERTSK